MSPERGEVTEQSATKSDIARFPAAPPITLEEAWAWLQKYKNTPFNMLALSVATDNERSPLAILAGLFNLAVDAIQALEEAEGRLAKVRTLLLIPGACHVDCPDVAAALNVLDPS